ncbi:hypothetical protein O181_033259 [Austropuccinia psidii MF-1]|uniref:Glucosamine 6-phosphate N-acetyltransferase n=1 Tax=Austropuccinia psidii MF-1 TaxID=1389203 RepID=A0A9Q3CYE6_9BASI|nr:hypothetical protein [Austropuccinia psidii MF-1]
MTLTPNSELELLIDPIWLPKNSIIHQDLHIRPLSSTDHQRDHLKLLSNLTNSPDLGLKNYQDRFKLLKQINSCSSSLPTYNIICIIQKSNDKLVGCGTLFLEHKFIRGNGSVGHIEDIVIDPNQRGKNLGKLIIETLTDISQKLGAYKTILDCNKDNIPFYEKCGYIHKEYEMVKYTPQDIIESHKNQN